MRFILFGVLSLCLVLGSPPTATASNDHEITGRVYIVSWEFNGPSEAVEGVTLQLRDLTGPEPVVVATTTTDAQGRYSFDASPYLGLIVEVVMPEMPPYAPAAPGAPGLEAHVVIVKSGPGAPEVREVPEDRRLRPIAGPLKPLIGAPGSEVGEFPLSGGFP